MRDQASNRINFPRAILKPKALLFWFALSYFLSVLYGLGGLSVYWGDAAVLLLAALALWLSRPWSYATSALLSAPIVYHLAFGFPFESAGRWWMWVRALTPENLGFIALSGIVFCYAAVCLLLMFTRQRSALS